MWMWIFLKKLPNNVFIFNNVEGLRSPTLLRMNYFEGVFQAFWSQIKKQILYRIYVLQSNHFWAKLPLAGCRTWSELELHMHLISNFNASRKQSLKESRVVTMEPFSIELIYRTHLYKPSSVEAIVYRSHRTQVF